MEKKEFYCPVYDGMVEKYDCDEISCGVDLGRFINDGLPFLMPIEEVVRSVWFYPSDSVTVNSPYFRAKDYIHGAPQLVSANLNNYSLKYYVSGNSIKIVETIYDTLISDYNLSSNNFSKNSIINNFEEYFNVIIDEIFIKRLLLVILLFKPAGVFVDIVFSDINFTNNETDKNEENNSLDHTKNVSNKIYKSSYIIGILERIIICMFVLMSEYTVIGFIITIKTWARSREIKEVIEFREKYLIGTLLSILIAIIIGVLL
jgi:hypothetical protein